MWTIHWHGMMGQALGLWDLIRVCNDQSHHHGPCAVQGTYLMCGEFRFKIPFKDKQDADSLCAYLRVMCASEIEETDGRTRLEVVFEGTGRECPTAVGYPGEPGVVGPMGMNEELDRMADDFWSSMAMGRTETRAFARAVAAAVKREDAEGPAACSVVPCNPVCRGNQGHQAPAEPA